MKRRRRTSAAVKAEVNEKAREQEEEDALNKENEELQARIEMLEMESLQKDVIESHISYLEFALDEVREEAEEYTEVARSILASSEFDRPAEQEEEEEYLDDAPSSMSSSMWRRKCEEEQYQTEVFPEFY